MRGGRDRKVARAEVVPRPGELESLERFCRRAQERDERGISRRRHDLSVLERDRVHTVHRLDDPAAAHGYADRIHL
jgi:hypothetical protein